MLYDVPTNVLPSGDIANPQTLLVKPVSGYPICWNVLAFQIITVLSPPLGDDTMILSSAIKNPFHTDPVCPFN